VFRCVVRYSLTAAVPLIGVAHRDWEYEHGMFIILMEQISRQAFPFKTSLNLKEDWGFFSKIVVAQLNFRYLGRGKHWRHTIHEADLFPHNFPETNLCIFTLVKCSSTVRLCERLAGAHTFLQSDAKARSVVQETSNAVNAGLRTCLTEGWIQRSGDHQVMGEERKLAKGEFRDKRWSNEVLVARRDKDLVKSASSVLRLSDEPEGAKRRSQRESSP
jgi:hypothetical protein